MKKSNKKYTEMYVDILIELLAADASVVDAIRRAAFEIFPSWREYIFSFEHNDRLFVVSRYEDDCDFGFDKGYGFEAFFKFSNEEREQTILNVVISGDAISLALGALAFQDWIVFRLSDDQFETKYKQFSTAV